MLRGISARHIATDANTAGVADLHHGLSLPHRLSGYLEDFSDDSFDRRLDAVGFELCTSSLTLQFVELQLLLGC